MQHACAYGGCPARKRRAAAPSSKAQPASQTAVPVVVREKKKTDLDAEVRSDETKLRGGGVAAAPMAIVAERGSSTDDDRGGAGSAGGRAAAAKTLTLTAGKNA